MLEELKENQKIMMNMIQGVLRAVNGGNVGTSLPEGATFPLKTMEDVDAMEQKLVDPAFLNGKLKPSPFNNPFPRHTNTFYY